MAYSWHDANFCAKCKTQYINRYGNQNYFQFLMIFAQNMTILLKIGLPIQIGSITCIVIYLMN